MYLLFWKTHATYLKLSDLLQDNWCLLLKGRLWKTEATSHQSEQLLSEHTLRGVEVLIVFTLNHTRAFPSLACQGIQFY